MACMGAAAPEGDNGSHDTAYIGIHPQAFLADVGVMPIVFDSGASLCVTPVMDDFVDTKLQKSDIPTQLGGLAHGLNIEGKGQVDWAFMSDAGTVIQLSVEAYYVPSASHRLLSPQSLFQQGSYQGTFVVDSGYGSLKFADGNSITRPLDSRTNLPLVHGFKGRDVVGRLKELNLCVTDEANQNLTASQKELLKWHYRLGHLNLTAIQNLLKTGAMGYSRLVQSASKCEHPKCASCEYGKARRKPTSATTTKPVADRVGALKHEDLFPGQCVSVDHFICSTKGRLYASRGRTADKDMYSGGSIYVDHASGFVHVEHQVSFVAAETVQCKHRFERKCRDMGVHVVSYQSDNGIFKAAEFVNHLMKQEQQIKFSGVGAHHQNGVAERSIGTIMAMARTMMLHAAIRWPDVMKDGSLWPMAVDYAVFIFNHVPNPTTGIAPVELITRSKWPREQFQSMHVWGCPTYVLDPTLQDGKKIPRWKPRSRRSVFVGLSPQHASTIPLVLSCETLAISPQFHVVFDDWFTTVNSELVEDDTVPEWFTNLFGTNRFRFSFDTDDPLFDEDAWVQAQASAFQRFSAQRERVRLATGGVAPPSVPTTDNNTGGSFEREIQEEEHPRDNDASPGPAPLAPLPQAAAPVLPSLSPSTSPSRLVAAPSQDVESSVRRSSRQRSAPERYGYDGSQGAGYFAPAVHLAQACLAISGMKCQREQELAYANLLQFDFDAEVIDEDPLSTFALRASTVRKDPDTLNYEEAMMDPDADGFLAAMDAEIEALSSIGTWELVRRCDVKTHVLPGTWAFKRKRYPDGSVRKLKARFCVRGDKQIEGIDYFESYAPVVSWSTVRMLLVMSIVFDLKTRQVDYTNAFAQADLAEDVYVAIPRRYRADSSDGGDYVLKLRKSLYGMVQSPRAFFQKLSKGLTDRGFKPSNIDPCLFFHRDMICLVYVDDCIFFARDQKKIDLMIDDLKKDFELVMEDEVSAFLGIQIDKLPGEESYKLHQKGLKQKILEYTGMTHCNADATPADLRPLGTDSGGAPFNEKWSYSAVVGMLMYLSANSHPEIGFAVHQCARFSHSPKQSHGKALKRICRYLKGVMDDGLVFTPKKELAVDCYVDADFAGLWQVEDKQDPIGVKSRTGYVLEFAGCPLVWVSKLQTEVALSTMEAEYIALSQAMRDLLPMRELVKEIAEFLKYDKSISVRTHSKVFEDNNGALTLATVPRMTPRSKHIAVKYHFFREHVEKGDVQVLPIDTKVQKADIFTKGLPPESFRNLRKLLCNW